MSAPAVLDALREALAWGKTYGPLLRGAEWHQQREVMAAKFAERLLAAAPEPPCGCGDRLASQCPGEWEPGCDLGNNEPFAVKSPEPPADPRDAEIARLRDALAGMVAIADDSRGVAGYHMNGDIAEWDEFDVLDLARAALSPPEVQR